MNKDKVKEKGKATKKMQEVVAKKDKQIEELTADLQRLRADFENYRKRVEVDKQLARDMERQNTIRRLLPVIDNIERAINHVPESLMEDQWAQGVVKLPQLLEKELLQLGVVKVCADPGTIFDPEVHEAVQMDENAEGETEVVAEELQCGYILDESILRPAMIKVTRK